MESEKLKQTLQTILDENEMLKKKLDLYEQKKQELESNTKITVAAEYEGNETTRLEQEKLEQEKQDLEKQELENLEQENLEQEKQELEKLEQEKLEQEKQELEKLEQTIKQQEEKLEQSRQIYRDLNLQNFYKTIRMKRSTDANIIYHNFNLLYNTEFKTTWVVFTDETTHKGPFPQFCVKIKVKYASEFINFMSDIKSVSHFTKGTCIGKFYISSCIFKNNEYVSINFKTPGYTRIAYVYYELPLDENYLRDLRKLNDIFQCPDLIVDGITQTENTSEIDTEFEKFLEKVNKKKINYPIRK